MVKMDPALVKSLGLHAAMVAMLLVSVNFTAEPTPIAASQAPVIQATFIDAQAIADKKREEQQKLAEQRKQQEIEQERERQRRQKIKAAEQRKAEQAKAKKAAEEKRKREIQKKRELERKAAVEAKRKREQEEAKRRQVEEAKKQAELDRLQEEQLAAERQAQQARRNQQILNEVDRYKAQIVAQIQRHIIEDPAFNGKRCRLNIKLASTGFVTRVKIMGGDTALCRLAENAVIREETLPVSNDPAVYEQLKDINLTVALKDT
jgi:colicin import membrane protein